MTTLHMVQYMGKQDSLVVLWERKCLSEGSDDLSVIIIMFYIISVSVFHQKYTQSNGRRPFGLSSLIIGFDYDGTPHLYQTDPSGTYHEWKVSNLRAGAF